MLFRSETLKGRGPSALTEVVCQVAARMVVLAGLAADEASASAKVADALSSGRALARLSKMITAQGGDARIIDDYRLLPTAPHEETLTATRAGFVSDIHAEAIGRGSAVLGAGRERVSDPVDHAVGVVLRVQPGDAVRAGDPLMTLHHRDGHGLEQARALCLDAVTITDARVEPRPDILGQVR